jgi:hypothetical protein
VRVLTSVLTVLKLPALGMWVMAIFSLKFFYIFDLALRKLWRMLVTAAGKVHAYENRYSSYARHK